MLASQDLDERIDLLENWILKAGKSLLSFYNPVSGTFRRNNSKKGTTRAKTSPTSTLRSFAGLLELKRIFIEEEENALDAELHGEVTSAIRDVTEKYLTKNPARKKVRHSTDNEINNFTDSHLLLAGSCLDHVARLMQREKKPLTFNTSSARLTLQPVHDALVKVISKKKGANLRGTEPVHDFISLYAIRGLDAYASHEPKASWAFEVLLQKRVRQDVLRQLGYHAAGVSSRFDASELAFSIVLLNRFPTPEAPQLTRNAVEALCASQREGAWPPARPVVYGTGPVLYIVSYEVALALTQLLLLQLTDKSYQVQDELLRALDATFDLARTAYSVLDDTSGWVNDHARSEDLQLLESWTTAIVLQFFIYFRDALMALRQKGILAKYNVTAGYCRKQCAWPDQEPFLRRQDWIQVEKADEICDPTAGGVLTAAIKTKIIVPISNDPFFRPRKRAASLVLYGLPGTRKTSLVRTLAKALAWPMLTISPPDFLKRAGLDGFEASAAEVFEDLTRLRRVVVLFDECEDFFKKRPGKQKMESRTIGAFITSGMLPRLQALRDKRWVFFVLATNSSLSALDKAVTRLGRFDWAHGMGHPTPLARKKYMIKKIVDKSIDKAIMPDMLWALQKFDADVPVSFAHLDELSAALAGFKPGQAKDIYNKLRRIVTGPTPPPLV